MDNMEHICMFDLRNIEFYRYIRTKRNLISKLHILVSNIVELDLLFLLYFYFEILFSMFQYTFQQFETGDTMAHIM